MFVFKNEAKTNQLVSSCALTEDGTLHFFKILNGLIYHETFST